MSHRNQRLLEGEVVEPEPIEDSEVDRLRDQVMQLSRERDGLRTENIRLRQRVNQTDAPVAILKKTLEPLYQALRAMWGEIEVIQPETTSTQNSSPEAGSKTSPVWEEWKQRLGNWPGRIITALQTHKDADTTQLCILIGTTRRQTVHDAIFKLNKSGLIDKNGDRYSLKQL